MIIGVHSRGWWVVPLLAALSGAVAERWRWPDSEPAAAERVDGKVRFIDVDDVLAKSRKSQRDVGAMLDEVPFALPTDTQGFYNRPPGAGRYRVRVDAPPPRPQRPYLVDGGAVYHVHNANRLQLSGTLDSLPYCKCVSEPDCTPRTDLPNACEHGKYLCCYNQKQPSKNNPLKAEYFNEVEDERVSLLPGQAAAHGAFPPPPDTFQRPVGASQSHQNDIRGHNQPAVLVGPGGPTGNVGPAPQSHQNDNRGHNQPAVLVGPGGPTGNVGPAPQNHQNDIRGHNQPAVLVGPGGPTGIVGPAPQSYQNDIRGQNQPAVLVGPGGPTGIIGPSPLRDHGRKDFNDPQIHNQFDERDDPHGPADRFESSASAQRGVLVGPGGPTGIIGPGLRRPVLVGPGGPTGIIGPTYERGVLVGPGGPTGYVGPAGYRPNPGLLVGPGGPTGFIGPRGPQRNYFFGK